MDMATSRRTRRNTPNKTNRTNGLTKNDNNQTTQTPQTTTHNLQMRQPKPPTNQHPLLPLPHLQTHHLPTPQNMKKHQHHLLQQLNEIDEFVLKFGEKWRKLITDSLQWLEAQEPKWDLPTPINKDEFLKNLTSQTNNEQSQPSSP
jgi:hypothetical protein